MEHTENNIWNKIDAVCVINLDHRTDRWEVLKEELSFLPEGKLHRISACWGKKLPTYGKGVLFRGCTEEEMLQWAGRAGCVLSHRKALAAAKQNNWDTVLILEDDAMLLDRLCGNVGNMILDTVEAQPEWDIIYPGFAPYDDKGVFWNKCQTEEGKEVSVFRMLGPLNTHCMLISASGRDKLLQVLPEEKKIWSWLAFHLSYDSWIANDFGKRADVCIAGLYPIVCVQRESASDIELTTRSSDAGRLGTQPFPITPISNSDFMARYHSLSFLRKKLLKLSVHRALGLLYYLIGFRRFRVSIAGAGYWGALKAAISVLRDRKK